MNVQGYKSYIIDKVLNNIFLGKKKRLAVQKDQTDWILDHDIKTENLTQGQYEMVGNVGTRVKLLGFLCHSKQVTQSLSVSSSGAVVKLTGGEVSKTLEQH